MSSNTLQHLGVEDREHVILVLDGGGGTTPQQHDGELVTLRTDDNGKPYAVQLRIHDQLVWFNFDRIVRWWCPPASKR